MPTGYTGSITDDMTFREFAMLCARNFGACIMMRDEPMDKEIPEEFKPSQWHNERRELAEKEAVRLASLTDEEADAEAQADYDREVERVKKWDREKERDRKKYDRMLAMVEEWEPPTPDHQSMKRFMRQQIVDTIKFDCSPYHRDTPRRKPGGVWLSNALAKAEQDIEYHTKHQAEEDERTASRNKWLKELRASL